MPFLSLDGDPILQCNLQDLFLAHAGKISNCANGSNPFPVSSSQSIDAGRRVPSLSEDPRSDRLAVYGSLPFVVMYVMIVLPFQESQVDYRVVLKLGCRLNDKLNSGLQ